VRRYGKRNENEKKYKEKVPIQRKSSQSKLVTVLDH
jgi:hypothetical protein